MLRNWEKGEATCILHANAPRREHTAQVSGSMEIRFTHICSGLRFDRFGWDRRPRMLRNWEKGEATCILHANVYLSMHLASPVDLVDSLSQPMGGGAAVQSCGLSTPLAGHPRP